MYFVRSSAAEGELHVGLALALAETTDPSSEVNVRWFVRNEWAKAKRHAWSFNPVFIIAGDPMNQQKRYETKEKLSHFCPVPVALTKTCIKEKKQLTQPKLLKDCVEMLRVWCSAHSLRTVEAPLDEGESKGAVSEFESEGESEGESSNESDRRDSSANDMSEAGAGASGGQEREERGEMEEREEGEGRGRQEEEAGGSEDVSGRGQRKRKQAQT